MLIPAILAATLSLADAQAIALKQVSAFRQAELEQRTAAEDLRQARASLLPRVRDSFSVTYNSRDTTGGPSFLASNSVHEYQNLIGVAGELDAGLLAAVHRAHALLDAARAGTEVARRALARGVTESYYGAALAHAKRNAAEQSLGAAEEFERVTRLNYEAGEVPEVDAIRARLQTSARRDDLFQSREAEAIADAELSALLGLNAVAEVEPLPQSIDPAAIESFGADGVMKRPELAQASAQLEAAHADVIIARGELLPHITYSLDRGFDSESLSSDIVRSHRGTLATANIDVPIFNWGIAFSRIRQAKLKEKEAAVQRELTTRELNVAYMTARAQVTAAVARVENAKHALDDAERNVTISIERYRAGEAPVSEATDAQTARAQERIALQQALYDAQVALAHLREAVGQ